MTEYKLNTKGLKLVHDFSKYNELASIFFDDNDLGPLTNLGYIAHKLIQVTDSENEFILMPKAIKNMDAEDLLPLMEYLTKINGK